MTLAQSLMSRRSTVWLPRLMPASASMAQARWLSAVISLGWLKWVLRYSGWYFLSIAHSSGVMRCGQTTGMREPMRMISTWSMARTRSMMASSCSSLSTSGSPPLMSTSRTSLLRSM